MTAIGGSVEEVNIEGTGFAVAADAEGNRFLGGFKNESQDNGNGTARLIKTRSGWMLNGLTLSIDDSEGDDEFLQDKIDSNNYFDVSFTMASGIVWEGQGQIVDDSETSTQSALRTCNFKGRGKLTRQV